jgi:hypothetical protein
MTIQKSIQIKQQKLDKIISDFLICHQKSNKTANNFIFESDEFFS